MRDYIKEYEDRCLSYDLPLNIAYFGKSFTAKNGKKELETSDFTPNSDKNKNQEGGTWL